MVIKLIDSDGDAIYVDPSLVAVIAPEYIDLEKTGGSIIHVRTGISSMRICINEKPEQVAHLVNTTKENDAKIAALRSLTQKEEADEEQQV